MSLDVTIYGEPETVKCICRECDNEHEHTRRPDLFSANITHNLGEMADEAGIYKHLWRPEELGITKAGELIAPLTAGVKLLESDRERFEKFNAPNGWGSYKNFLPWVKAYLAACEAYPDGEISVSR